MRPSASQSGWRAREVAKARERKELEKKLAEEVQAKKLEKTTTNFPTLSGSAGGGGHVVFDTSFSSLAANWQTSDDIERKLQEYRREKDAKRQFETTGVYVQRFRAGRMDGDSSSDEGPAEPYVFVPPKVDCDGWQEVKVKTRKEKRELTMAEIAQKYHERGEGTGSGSEGDHNEELFDTNRHDHR